MRATSVCMKPRADPAVSRLAALRLTGGRRFRDHNERPRLPTCTHSRCPSCGRRPAGTVDGEHRGGPLRRSRARRHRVRLAGGSSPGARSSSTTMCGTSSKSRCFCAPCQSCRPARRQTSATGTPRPTDTTHASVQSERSARPARDPHRNASRVASVALRKLRYSANNRLSQALSGNAFDHWSPCPSALFQIG